MDTYLERNGGPALSWVFRPPRHDAIFLVSRDARTETSIYTYTTFRRVKPLQGKALFKLVSALPSPRPIFWSAFHPPRYRKKSTRLWRRPCRKMAHHAGFEALETDVSDVHTSMEATNVYFSSGHLTIALHEAPHTVQALESWAFVAHWSIQFRLEGDPIMLTICYCTEFLAMNNNNTRFSCNFHADLFKLQRLQHHSGFEVSACSYQNVILKITSTLIQIVYSSHDSQDA
jgi:hypothetical protein